MKRLAPTGWLTAALLLIAASGAASGARFSDCPTVVRAHFEDPSQVASVAAWTEPWEVHYDEGYLVAAVSAEGWGRFEAAGFRLEIDEKMTRTLCSQRSPLKNQRSGIPAFPCYRTVEETFAAAEALVAENPTLAALVDIGDSWEKTEPGGSAGFDLRVLILSNQDLKGTATGVGPGHGKPRLFVTSAIHAREYATAELTTRLATELLDSYGSDADATWLLDEHELHFLLHANPDGRKQAETGLYWRKNTNENYCSPTSEWRGADLNRNFEFQWGCCGGSSGDECNELYRGPSTASEPEVQTVQAYARSIFPDQREADLAAAAPATATGVYIDVHAHGHLVLWPWGFGSSVPGNSAGLRALGRKLAFFNDYSPDQGIGLYPTDGTTVDFMYGDLGVAAYTFELGTTFFQDCGTFESTILPDNMASLIYAAKVARSPYLTPSGPDISDIAFPSTPIAAPGAALPVTAIADDTRFNTSNGAEDTQTIASASFTIDAPPWSADAGTPGALFASDGFFNSKIESVTGSIPTGGLAEGRHAVFFQANDASASEGAVSSAFFWVLDPATIPHIAGRVVSAEDSQPLEATVTAGGFSTVSNPIDGTFDLAVPAGTYTVRAQATDRASASTTGIVATSSSTTTVDFMLATFQDLFVDDAEGGNLGWTAESPWALTTEASDSPSHSWTDSPGGNYGDEADTSLISQLFDFTDVSGIKLEFSHIYDFEEGYDYGIVEYSRDDGDTWTSAATVNGTETTTWTRKTVELPELDGVATARVRFRVQSDVYLTQDGWHLDDIALSGGESQVLLGTIFRDGFESGNTEAWTFTSQ